MSAIESSIPAVLAENAVRRPDETAYTFIDYDVDPAGFAESVTWSQLQRRVSTVAEELRRTGTTGDRVAILGPQSLEYLIGFFGALQAGFIAVPLSVPQLGAHDSRVESALADCTPAAIMTTSAAVDGVVKYAEMQGTSAAPAVIEIDSLDFYSTGDFKPVDYSHPKEAYLQYTSGSTGQPAGVIITHENVIANCHDLENGLFDISGPPESLVSWLPFYHDMGLIQGICFPAVWGRPSVLTSPLAFLIEPARWMKLLAANPRPFSGGPNFAFDLAVRRISDDDMAGLDLGQVVGLANGSERVQPASIARFMERFAKFNLPETAVRPSYGLAEATLYVASAKTGQAPGSARFQYDQLSGGHAKQCTEEQGGSELTSYGALKSPLVRIVDPETKTETPSGVIGEIWANGKNIGAGYWRNPERTKATFGARLANPSEGTPEGGWLRTGDLGFMSDGELFIMGRLKDLLIVDGRNHYPDDIELTVTQITKGRVAAISVANDTTEQLVAIAEVKSKGSDEDALQKLRSIKRDVTAAISNAHGVRISDLVLVAPGSLPLTTSGKVRRSTCIESYRREEFERLDVSA
ncbi:Acyl-CoA synthetase (AMP-forming)/AMP-acid ligase II [Mycobacterium rhizamassiliense]|uniref:Acyl-CoA synthetase (AMP-forming)/AMP-acid ligase II n=1 Tax=Mycobacterium rhizamassiliense TaxID=1841860 RepID=A0A2U3P1I5_9MYCO|nr:AMP-binding protein [Mycobacterium rhizamassiliense]SPM37632.1 Acyl-CoA synthetase (AMP-forming)/AMP-acid ligase II [Mycobacterium rhizamassiliense]